METVNQGIDETVNQGEKTLTQDEANAIIADRLKRERAKYADYEELKKKAEQFDAIEEASKTELQKAQDLAASLKGELDALKKAENVRTIRDGVARETGVPAALLTGDTEDACRDQATAILAFAKPDYPTVKDGGEVRTTGKKPTREQFAEWLNS